MQCEDETWNAGAQQTAAEIAREIIIYGGFPLDYSSRLRDEAAGTICGLKQGALVNTNAGQQSRGPAFAAKVFFKGEGPYFRWHWQCIQRAQVLVRLIWFTYQ